MMSRQEIYRDSKMGCPDSGVCSHVRASCKVADLENAVFNGSFAVYYKLEGFLGSHLNGSSSSNCCLSSSLLCCCSLGSLGSRLLRSSRLLFLGNLGRLLCFRLVFICPLLALSLLLFLGLLSLLGRLLFLFSLLSWLLCLFLFRRLFSLLLNWLFSLLLYRLLRLLRWLFCLGSSLLLSRFDIFLVFCWLRSLL